MNDPWLNRPGEWEAIGGFQARVGAAYRTPEMRRALGALASAGAAEGVPCGRAIRFRAEAADGTRGCELLVQRFPVSRRSDALRAVDAAERLQGRAVRTPNPVACLLRSAGSGRWEGWAVFQSQPGLMPLRDWIERLLTGQNDFGRVCAWVRAVGAAIRDLHEAGVFHGNLDAWSIWVDSRRAPREGIRFFELERCVIGAAPGALARLRDWATLDLPRRLLAEAMDAGLGEGAAPAIARLLRILRRGVSGVRRLRGWRLPPPVDTACAFLWDASGDGAVDLDREGAAAVAPGWRRQIGSFWPHPGRGARPFAAPEPMLHRLAMGVGAVSETSIRDVSAGGGQGFRDVWVRLCCHDSDERRAAALATIQNMAKAGFSVSILLIQDRRAVLEPERWVDFVSRALEPVGWQVGRAVYGYAPDEPAWGIRSTADYRRFLATLPTMRAAYPGTVFAGPACAVTNSRFLARTAGAARQAGGWESWVCRASADWVESNAITDRVWLGQLARFCRAADTASEEATRPILVIEPPGGGGRDAATHSVGNESAEGRLARHVRRTLLAVCSGLVEQVVLMQTPSAGDSSQQIARQDVWRTFLRRIGSGGRCAGRVAIGGSETAWLLHFEDTDGASVWLGWSDGEAQIVAAAVRAERAYDLLGRNAPLLPAPRMRLTDMPAYFDSQPHPAA